MTEREHEAIRILMNLLRTDQAILPKVLSAMIAEGFTAEETQAAINEIARRQ